MLSLFLGLQMACTGSVASDVDTGSATVDSQESPVDSSTDTGELIDRDQDGSPASKDCDDGDPSIFPGAAEV